MLDTPYEQRRARALCLAGIVAVSLCAGALLGRYSAVVFPIASVASVPAEARPQPAQHAASRSGRSLAEHLNLKSPAAGEGRLDNTHQNTTVHETGSTPQTAGGPKTEDSTQKQSLATENIEKDGQTSEQPDSKVSGATILNPEASQRAPDARKMPDSMSPRDIAETQLKLSGDTSPANSECARRYASFRESDGTYQPYGSAHRKVCPLLR
jgi:hypothetical protein